MLFERGGEPILETSLAVPGEAARLNAALAIECVHSLGMRGALGAVDGAEIGVAVRRALPNCRLPARTEVLEADSAVVIDAAHTQESAKALAAAMGELAPSGFDLLLSVSGDKNLAALLGSLLPGARRVIVTRADPTRSLPVEELAERVEAHVRESGLATLVETIEDPAQAARRARDTLPENLKLCAAGSVYLAGIARSVLGGGIAAEAAQSPVSEGPSFSSLDPAVEIGPARAEEISLIPDLERRAGQLFSPDDLPSDLAEQTLTEEEVREAFGEGRLIVARSSEAGEGGELLGFALLEVLADGPHLEEVDVDPRHGRRGIGRKLVEAACSWALASGAPSITLSTFRDVPWNGPFYARLGFEILEESDLTEALQELRRKEQEGGLDIARRVIMRRRL